MSAPAGATHVLSWLPRYLIGKGWDRGYWELMTLAEEAEYGWQSEPDLCADLPRAASFDAIAGWVADHVGFPFALHEATREIRGLHWWNRWHSEPVFYVIPDPDGKRPRHPQAVTSR